MIPTLAKSTVVTTWVGYVVLDNGSETILEPVPYPDMARGALAEHLRYLPAERVVDCGILAKTTAVVYEPVAGE